MNYWKVQLKDIPSRLEFTYDKPIPNILTSNSDRVLIEIGEYELNKINQLSKSENSTLFMFLMAAYQFLLSKYTNVFDIVVGTPIAGR